MHSINLEMPRNNKHFLTVRITEATLPWIAGITGALVAIWVIAMAHGSVNRDGTLYLRVADLFAAGEWSKGVALYNWPFYSLLIAGIHQLTGLSLQYSGHLLTVFLYGLSSAAWVKVLGEAGGDRRVMVAGLMLWFASPYLVGDIVPKLFREDGFWAALLWGLWFLLRFARTPEWGYAVGWGASTTVATLFRIEGLTFLALLPVALLFRQELAWKSRLYQLTQVHTMLLTGALVLGIVFLIHPSLQLTDLGRLEDPLDVIRKIWYQVTRGFSEKAEIYGEQVLGSFLDDYALIGLLLTLAWILISKIAGAAGFVQTLLFLAALNIRHALPTAPALHVLATFGILGVLNCLAVLFTSFLLSSRMVAPAAFPVMLLAAFLLGTMFKETTLEPGKKVKGWMTAVVVLICIQLVLGLRPHGRNAEMSAVQWIQDRKQPHEKVFYDHPRLHHYAGEPFPSNIVDFSWDDVVTLFKTGSYRNYHYVVVRGSDESPEKEEFLTKRLGPPIAQFRKGSHGRILIYQVE